jgi:WhiB family redox-sensing transcriptional regulator
MSRYPAIIHLPLRNPNIDEEWRTRALCRDWIDDNVWMPDDPKDAEFGKGVCNGTYTGSPCPVRGDCRAWALERREKFGTYGGLSEWDRDRLLRPNGMSRNSKRRRAG